MFSFLTESITYQIRKNGKEVKLSTTDDKSAYDPDAVGYKKTAIGLHFSK